MDEDEAERDGGSSRCDCKKQKREKKKEREQQKGVAALIENLEKEDESCFITFESLRTLCLFLREFFFFFFFFASVLFRTPLVVRLSYGI